MRGYADREFAGTGVSATLSGRANLNFRWIDDLAKSHFASLIVALLLVLTVSGLLFRSVTAGLYTLIPVCAAVLLVYATMVLLGINLGMGTSMFAAVAVGLGIDFAIHTVERLRAYIDKHGGDMDAVFEDFYQSTGKALLLNFLAIASGFGVLMFSKIASLNWFGAIVVLAVASSFLASMTLLCALIKVVRPRFIQKILVSDGRYTV